MAPVPDFHSSDGIIIRPRRAESGRGLRLPETLLRAPDSQRGRMSPPLAGGPVAQLGRMATKPSLERASGFERIVVTGERKESGWSGDRTGPADRAEAREVPAGPSRFRAVGCP